MSSTQNSEPRTQNTLQVPWGPEELGLRIQIWTDQLEYRWGQDIWLHLAIENCSDQPLLVRSTSTFQNSNFHSPLYSLNFLRVRNQWQGGRHTWDLYPLGSSMYKTLELTKLPPGDILEEKSLLTSGLWMKDGDSRSYPLPVGDCILQAEYKIDLSEPMFQVKQSVLEQLPFPLWTGTTFSNQWPVTMVRKSAD